MYTNELEATKMLKEVGLEVKVEEEFSDDVEKNIKESVLGAGFRKFKIKKKKNVKNYLKKDIKYA